MPTTLKPVSDAGRSGGVDFTLQLFLRAEVASLRDLLDERDAEIVLLRYRLEAGRSAKFQRALTTLYLCVVRNIPSLRRRVRMLEASDLFDAHWYARRYPHCGGSKFSAIHYLSMGALQGHDPGPYFSTSDYYRANPDVAAARIPALAHYLLNGRREGRALFPVPAQVEVDRVACRLKAVP